MANSDKRQAIQDALKDILKVRQLNKMGMGGMAPQGGEIDMDIDPDLNTPQPNDMDTPPMNIEINDPDGVLDQQKQNKQQQKQQGGSGQGSGQDDEGQDQPDSQDGGSSGGGQQQKGQKGSKGQKGGNQSGSGDQGDDDDGDDGQEGGSSSNGGQQGKKQNGKNSSGGNEQSDKGDNQKGNSAGDSRKKGITQDDIEKMSQQGGGTEKTDDYVQDWNDAIKQFDKDDVSDKELEKQLNDKNNSEATKDAIKAIQDSRERKLEIDPDTIDPRMKMPKNSEMKKFEDEDKEGPESDGEDTDDFNNETAEQRAQRIAKIQKDFEDQDAVDKDIKDIEADVAIKKADALRAQKETQRKLAAKGKLLDFSTFSTDLYDAIKSQIDSAPEPEDSYYRPNASYAGTDYLMPGVDYPDRPMIPEINVYFDQSGSWGAADIEKGVDAISTLDEFENQRRLKINLFYFSEHLHDTPRAARAEGMTSGFGEVIQHIKDSGADNVIVMTDSDIQNQTDWSDYAPVEVPGCVWWLWKEGSRSKTALNYVIGEQGNYQYNLQ